MKKVLGYVFVFFLVCGLAACTSTNLDLVDPWARPGEAGGNSAAYLILDNPTATDEVLLSASCDAAAHTELHQMTMEDGVMKMSPVDSIPVPAGEQVTLAPGGLHVMLIGLERTLVEGETITITLEFAEAGLIEIQAPIEQR